MLGALTGPWPAMWGILSFGALAFVLSVAAAQATFGLPATGVMAIGFVDLLHCAARRRSGARRGAVT